MIWSNICKLEWKYKLIIRLPSDCRKSISNYYFFALMWLKKLFFITTKITQNLNFQFWRHTWSWITNRLDFLLHDLCLSLSEFMQLLHRSVPNWHLTQFSAGSSSSSSSDPLSDTSTSWGQKQRAWRGWNTCRSKQTYRLLSFWLNKRTSLQANWL